jgi:hypothetical protein
VGEHHRNCYEARAAVRGHSADRGSHPEDLQPGVATHGVTPGAIVRCRNRDWVLLPGDSPAVYVL